MDKVTYTIPGTPIALKRARTSRGRFYDPQSQDKKALQMMLRYEQNAFCFDEPLQVVMGFYMPIPKSWSKKKQAAAIGQPHTGTPDLSNLIKFYEDMANGLLWRDDCLIYNLKSFKLYSDNPRTAIEITPC